IFISCATQALSSWCARPLGPQEERVACGNLEAGPLLPRVDVSSTHPCSRYVEQDASGYDAVLGRVDRQLRAATVACHDIFEVESVIILSVVRNVTERVEMRKRSAVVLDFLTLKKIIAIDEKQVRHRPTSIHRTRLRGGRRLGPLNRPRQRYRDS